MPRMQTPPRMPTDTLIQTQNRRHTRRQLKMKWKDFLERAKKAGIKDDDDIFYIDFQFEADEFSVTEDGVVIS